ncbi:MOSC domain-containing protein [Salinisphaera hydrothermalis]|uniref:MOSC domain-containing protein n=1 Tax=Salinisphaera hydrothermalis TaxID=563188 RepID=UPI00333F25EC
MRHETRCIGHDSRLSTPTQVDFRRSYPAAGPDMRLIGRLAGLYIASERSLPMTARDSVRADAGRGLVGDRYHRGTGTFSRRTPLTPGARALSILDTETLAICRRRLEHELPAAMLRRNLLIETGRLETWAGRELLIGEVRIMLAGRCPPCGYLSRLLGADMRAALHGLGGMRARIVSGGHLSIGDPVYLVDDSGTQRGLPG